MCYLSSADSQLDPTPSRQRLFRAIGEFGRQSLEIGFLKEGSALYALSLWPLCEPQHCWRWQSSLRPSTPTTFAAEPTTTPTAIEGRLQSLVGNLKKRLEIAPAIVVTIVPSNALMMSVEAPTEPAKPFLLSVDASFLNTLTDDEIEAAIAHELGHVWIFTHHPYLQTEELANQIAMRAVSRAVSSASTRKCGNAVARRAISRDSWARRLRHSPLLQGSHQTRLAKAKPLASQLIVKDLRDRSIA